MAVVAITDARCVLGDRDGALAVHRGGQLVRALQPHEISELQIWGNVEISAAARNLLLREGIDTVFFTASGRFRGRTTAAESRLGDRRVAQYRAHLDPGRRLAFAQALVAGKLHHQRLVLLARQKHLQDERLGDILSRLRHLVAAARQAPNLDSLRGHEGLGARVYFEGLGMALTNPAFLFDGRNRRPPRDPPNACLSFGYAVVLSKVEGAVRAAGLDPYVGFLHEATRGNPALALDLCEEYRPVVDGVVWTLLNRRQLTPEDFRIPLPEELGAEGETADQAVWLGEVARGALLRALEQRFETPQTDPLTGNQWPLSAIVLNQARAVARWVEGAAEAFIPFDPGA